MTKYSRAALVAPLLLLLSVTVAGADAVVPPEQMPGPLKEVRFDQKLGDRLPLDARLTDESGAPVVLGDFFGEKPVLLTFAYFDCPMLCPMVLSGLAKALSVLAFDVGQELDVVVVSIDPSETAEQAAQAELTMLHRYGRTETGDGWHFLVGEDAEVRRIADAAGFQYAWVEDVQEWAHASGIVVVAPDGTLAQYYYGIEYPPKDLRLAVVDASEGRVGNVVDQILLYCFRYDPQLGRYTAVAMRILRLTGVAFIIVLAASLFFLFRGDRNRDASPNLGAASS